MKYRFLLRFLRLLVYIKRFFWWLGKTVRTTLFKAIKLLVWRPTLYIQYKLKILLKQLGLDRLSELGVSRTVLQTGVFVLLGVIALPETKLYQAKDLLQPGQKTLAYALSGGDEEDAALEEVTAESAAVIKSARNVPNWKDQALNTDSYTGGVPIFFDQEFYGSMAGGMALSKPEIAPGATLVGAKRNQTEQYVVESGDSLSSIAYQFGVSVATILWDNNLNLKSFLKPGQALTIPPATGVRHTIKKGDSLKKIATRYEAKVEDIVAFNKLKADGTDLIIGETIMV